MMKLHVEFTLITAEDSQDDIIQRAMGEVNTHFDKLFAEDDDFNAFISGATAYLVSGIATTTASEAVQRDVEDFLEEQIENLIRPNFEEYTITQITWTLSEVPAVLEELM